MVSVSFTCTTVTDPLTEIPHFFPTKPEGNQLGNYSHQWLFLVPLKGGIGGIVHPPIGRKNTTYSPCLRLGGYMLPIPPFTGT